MSTHDILILIAHPGRDRLAHALAAAYAEGAQAAGATTRTLALAELRFDLSLHNGFEGDQPLEPDLLAAQSAIESCRHLVIVTPLWWGTDPALLKGFIDRTFLPHWAFRYTERGLPEGLLKGRSARVIRTMDSPRWWYRLVLRSPADAPLERSTLRFCGISPVRHTHLAGIHSRTPAQLVAYLSDVRAEAARDARQLPRRRLPAVNTAAALTAGTSPG